MQIRRERDRRSGRVRADPDAARRPDRRDPPELSDAPADRRVRLPYIGEPLLMQREKAREAEHVLSVRDRDGGGGDQLGEPRGVIAEWTVTIILLLFGTTTLVQAFVIPTGSMEDTLLIGDHLLVDKLAYAPPGPITKYLLPY